MLISLAFNSGRTLHQKLSSPDRKKRPKDIRKKIEEKHVRSAQ